MKQAHVTIVGGGLVGATCALALSHFGWPICVIEKNKLSDIRPECPLLQSPTLALSYASKAIFEKLGLWSSISDYTTPIKSVQVTTKGHHGSTTMQQPSAPYSALGYVVDVLGLKSVLHQALQQCAHVTVIDEAIIKDSEYHDSSWYCQSDQITGGLETKLLVAAEGAQSALAGVLGIHSTVKKYSHLSMMVNVRLSRNLNGLAIERFLPKGVIALLPGKENIATLVLSLMPDEMALLRHDNSQNHLLSCIQGYLGSTMGMVEEVGAPQYLALNMTLANQHFYPRLLLLGNSAHSIHPIAAQGFNLSLRDIIRLQTAIASHPNPEHWGKSIYDLSAYVRDCQQDQQKIIAMTDSLAHKLDNIPSLLRAIGLLSLDSCFPIKKQITLQAMGI